MSRDDRLRAVLFDVGGTLTDDATYQLGEAADRERLRRLEEAFGDERPWFAELLRGELEREELDGVRWRQDTRLVVRRIAAELGVSLTAEEAERVRAACCLPGAFIEKMRPGAAEALRWARGRGLRIALVTNVLWRTEGESLRDWSDRGVADCIDAIVTSIDVGWRKPHPAMFESALARLGVEAEAAVMVGNSRLADIAPAKRLGMRAVAVRSRDRSLAEEEPDAVIDEMTELRGVLERWV